MARAIRRFSQAIERAENLLNFAENLQDENIRKDNIRMAIVLAISGMDGYFTSKFRDIITPYLYNNEPGDDLIKLLENAGLNTRTALELIWMDRPLRRIGTLIERHFDRYTTQRFEAIDELFKAIGLQKLSENAERKIGRKTLRSSVSRLVTKRHQIVHDADINSHAKQRSVNLDETRRRIKDVKLFVMACDEILENRISN